MVQTMLREALADPETALQLRRALTGPVLPFVAGTSNQDYLMKDDGFGTAVDTVTPVFEDATNKRIGIGTANPVSNLDVQVSGAPGYIALSAYEVDVYDKGFLVRSAKGTPGSPTAVVSGNILFNLYAQGYEGSSYGISTGITSVVDGTVSSGIVPGALLLQTTNSAGTFAERMRITASGNVGIGTASPEAKLTAKGTAFEAAGTVDVSAGLGVTGTNTKFLSEVHVGDKISLTTSAGLETRMVTAVNSDTSLTVHLSFDGTADDATLTVYPMPFRAVDDSGKVLLQVADTTVENLEGSAVRIGAKLDPPAVAVAIADESAALYCKVVPNGTHLYGILGKWTTNPTTREAFSRSSTTAPKTPCSWRC